MRGWAGAILVTALAGCSSGFDGNTETASPAAYSGSSTPAAMDQQQVTQELQDQGYTDVTNLSQSGPDWTGTALNRNGQSVSFDVDPYGAVHVR